MLPRQTKRMRVIGMKGCGSEEEKTGCLLCMERIEKEFYFAPFQNS